MYGNKMYFGVRNKDIYICKKGTNNTNNKKTHKKGKTVNIMTYTSNRAIVNLCTFRGTDSLSRHITLLKESTLKGKNLLPRGANSFREGPVSEDILNAGKQSHKSISF